MKNKTLLWIIPHFDKKYLLKSINLNELSEVAIQNNFKPSFLFLTNNKLQALDDFKINTELEYTVKVYDEKICLNTILMKELNGDINFDNIFVCGTVYLNNFELINEMLGKASLTDANFIHARKKQIGIYGDIKSVSKFIYNKVVKLFTDSIDKLYFRNCVIFDKLVLDLIHEFPTNSSLIQETNSLVLTTTEVVEVEKIKKKMTLSKSSVLLLLISGLICLGAIAMLLLICLKPMSLDLILWLIVGIIVLATLGIILTNYAVLKDKIKIDRFNAEKVKTLTPTIVVVFNEKTESETKDKSTKIVFSILPKTKKEQETKVKTAKKGKTTTKKKEKTTNVKKTGNGEKQEKTTKTKKESTTVNSKSKTSGTKNKTTTTTKNKNSKASESRTELPSKRNKKSKNE